MQSRTGRRGQLNKLQKSLLILSLVGSFTPWLPHLAIAAGATVITPNASFDLSRGAASGTSVTTSGNVTNVETTKIVNGNTAVNVFDKYQVGQGNVVNMWLGTKASNANANLVNLVNDHIDINGTVNAIQNNKIGGNMYFLSSSGIAVGASGVINTGSLYLMTPTSAAMETIIDDNEVDASALSNAMRGGLALNPEATITVAGKINANNNVLLTAGHITTENTSVLTTGVTDFSSLVNLTGVDAGLGQQKLTAKGENGNISLVAQDVGRSAGVAIFGPHTFAADVTQNGTIKASGDVTLAAAASTVARTVTEDWLTNKYTAKVTQNGTITADGKVNITAITNSTERLADKTAQIDINGQVSGANVNIAATAYNDFVDSMSVHGLISEALGTAVGVEWDADYSLVNNLAQVNINKGAVVTATQKESGTDTAALNISAGADTENSLGSNSSKFRYMNVSSWIPAASVTWLKSTNNAKVNVDGTLNSQGKTVVKAAAISNIYTGAAVGVGWIDNAEAKNTFSGAYNHTDATNNAVVTIGADAGMAATGDAQNLKGDLSILADAKNRISATTSASGSTKAAVGTVITDLTYNSAATIDVAGKVTAPNVTIKAKNTVEDNIMQTTNAMSDGQSEGFSEAFTDKTALPEALLKKINDQKTKDNTTSGLNQYLTLGASLAFATETFNSAVNLANTADVQGNLTENKVSVPGNVTIASETDIQDTNMVTTGTLSKYKGSDQYVNVEAAYQNATINMNSTVNIAGGTKEQHAIVNGANVDVTANSTMEYNRAGKMTDDWINTAQAIRSYFAEIYPKDNRNKEQQKALDDLDAYITKMEGQKNKNTDKLDFTATDLEAQGSNIGAKYKACWDGWQGLLSFIKSYSKDVPLQILSLYTQTKAFVNPNSYANFAVSTAAEGVTAGHDAKLDVSGSVNVSAVHNNSRVLIGKEAMLEADNKLNAIADATAESVSFTGNSGVLFLPAMAQEAGVGASIAVNNFNNNSLTMVAEAAKLNGLATTVKANSKLTDVGVVYTAGAAKTLGISGMFNYMGGGNTSIVSVDDEAYLSGADHTGHTGLLDITAVNDNTLVNIAGGFSKGTSISVGAGVGYSNFDVANYAVLGDNDADADVTQNAKESTDEIKLANKVKAATSKAWTLSGLSAAEKTALLGSEAAVQRNSYKIGDRINVNATTTGRINTIGLAGSVTNEYDKDGATWLGTFNKIAPFFAWPAGALMNWANGRLDSKMQAKAAELQNARDRMANGNIAEDAQGADAHKSFSNFHLDVAASGAINTITGGTEALVDKSNLTAITTAGSEGTGVVQVEALDNMFMGAWAGAAAVNYVKSSQGGAGNVSVALSGDLAYNDITRDALAAASNLNLNNAGTVKVTATRKGDDVAAGLGLAFSSSQDMLNVELAAAASVNKVTNNVGAYLVNVQQDNWNSVTTDVTVLAEDRDVQITGGLNLDRASGTTGVALGGGMALTLANMQNNVTADIIGGTYNQAGAVRVDSVLGTKQITTGVGVSLASSTGKSGLQGAAEGAITSTEIANKVGTQISGATINTAGSVQNRAYSINPGSNDFSASLAQMGLDEDGTTFVTAVKTQVDAEKMSKVESAAVTEVENGGGDLNASGALQTALTKTGEDGGNLIINGALAVAGVKGGGAAGVAFNLADVDNTFTSVIDKSTINAGTVKAQALNNAVILNLAAGASGSGSTQTSSYNGAASYSGVNLTGDMTARITDSTIAADTLNLTAINNTTAVNITGQLAWGSVGGGLSFAWTDKKHNITSELLGSTVNPWTSGQTDIYLLSNDTDKMFTLGIGAGVTTKLGAADGVIAINSGSANVKTRVANLYDETAAGETRHTYLNKVHSLNVLATDDATVTAVAGGLTAGKGISAGGAVAYNDIGGSGTDTAKAKQQQLAALDNTDLTTTGDALITVKAAQDKAKLTTVAIGLGASTKLAADGAAAVTLVNKKTTAELNDTLITRAVATDPGAKVTVSGVNDNEKIVNVAGVVALSSFVGGGAGVAVNRMEEDTTANIKGSTLNVSSAEALALSQPHILNLGAGLAAGKTGGAAGSYNINLVTANTRAEIDTSKITASGSVGAVAQSDNTIASYAGAIGAGTVAGAGLTAAVNELGGDTLANVNDSIISAAGADNGMTVNSDVDDAKLDKGIVAKATWGLGDTLQQNRKSSTVQGLVIDASSTNYIHSNLATAGGASTASLMGDVNVNYVGGSTSARLTATKDKLTLRGAAGAATTPVQETIAVQNGTTGAVHVKAADFTSSMDFVGEAGGAGTVALGGAVAAETVSRDVTALAGYSGVDGKDDGKTRLAITAGSLSVEAVSKQGFSSLLVGGQGSGTASATAALSKTKLTGTTKAYLSHVDAHVNGATSLTGYNYASLGEGNNVGGLALNAGIGASINVLTDDRTVAVTSDDNQLITGGDLTVKGENATKILTENIGLGLSGAGVGVAGNISYNDVKNKVQVTVKNSRSTADNQVKSTLQSTGGKVDIHAANNLTLSANGGTLAVTIKGLGAGVGVVTNRITETTTVDISDTDVTGRDAVGIKTATTNDVGGYVVSINGGALDLGVNVVNTTIGTAVSSTDSKITEALLKAQTQISKGSDMAASALVDRTLGLSNTERTAANAKTSLDLTTGAAATHVTLKDSTVTAGAALTIGSSIATKMNSNCGAGGIGIGSLNIGYNDADLHNDLDTNIAGSTLKGKNITINALLTDTGTGKDDHVKVLAGMGGVGGVDIKKTTARVVTDGTVAVNINGVTMSDADSISIVSKDNSTTEARTYGISVGGLEVGDLQSEADNKVATKVNIGLNALKDAAGQVSTRANVFTAAADLEVKTDRSGKVIAYTLGGTGAVVGGIKNYATGLSDGESSVNFTGTGSVFTAPLFMVDVYNTPAITSNVNNQAYGIVAGIPSVNTGTLNLTTNISVASGNTFANDAVFFSGNTGLYDELTNNVQTMGIGGTLADKMTNYATAAATTNMTISVGQETYKQNADGTGATTLSVNGLNSVSQISRTDLCNTGLAVAVTNSHATATQDNHVTINASGGTVGNLALLAYNGNQQYVDATGNGGGLLSISPYASEAKSELTNTNAINVSGIWQIAQNALINADGEATVYAHGKNHSGGVVSGAGANVRDTLTETTNISILDGAEITAQNLTAVAKNIFVTNDGKALNKSLYLAAFGTDKPEDTSKIDDVALAVEGVAGGVGAGNGEDAYVNVTSTTGIAIGKKARVTTADSQSYTAFTDATLKNNVKSVAGGVAAGATGLSNNTYLATDEISAAGTGTAQSTADNSILTVKNYQDSSGKVNSITMSAYDNLDLTAKVTATAGGFGVGSNAKSLNTITRNSNIRADGFLNSNGNVNIYAGDDSNGAGGKLKAVLEAGSYSGALIGIYGSTVTRNIYNNHNVEIGASGVVSSVGDISLKAETGNESVSTKEEHYTIWGGKSGSATYATNDLGTVDGEITPINYVRVDGQVSAGINNIVSVEITGKKALEGTTFADGTTGGYIYTVNGSPATAAWLQANVTEGTLNYANGLYRRYMDLGKLVQEYQVGETDNLTAYYGYKAEMESIFNEMKKLNMLVTVTKNGGETQYYVVDNYGLNYIKLADMAASGGNVTITTNDLGGSGKLQTSGSPKISINNETDAYLQLGNLTLGKEGGQILYNKHDITGKSNAYINALNRDNNSKESAYLPYKDFAKFSAAPAVSTDSKDQDTIKVTANYSGGPEILSYTDAGTTKTITYTPVTSIEVNGMLTNNLGNVTVDNEKGDITFQASGTNTKAGVVAKTITIKAPNGNVNQGYVDGVLNLGLTPETYYADWLKSKQSGLIEKGSSTVHKAVGYTSELPAASDNENSTWIAGGNVTISARDLNVNGKVQSGYGRYYAFIAEDALTTANLNSYQTTKIKGVTVYKVNDGNKAVYNETTGVYDYLVQVYYDPQTKKLLVDDVNAAGGYIHVTGNIISTGNGSLTAADGGAEITISNKTGADMDVGRIINNDRVGSITVTDLVKKLETVYTKDATRVTDLTTNVTTLGAAGSTYTPQSGLRYNWTNGTETSNRTQYTTSIYDDEDKFKADKRADYEAEAVQKLPEDTKYGTVKEVLREDSTTSDKTTGVYIGSFDAAHTGLVPSGDLVLIYDKTNVSDNRSDVTSWTVSHKFLWFGHYDYFYKWTNTTGSVNTFVNSLAADKAINVKFLQGNGNITVSSNHNINLQGNIQNATAAAQTAISSSRGAISQDVNASIVGNNVQLTAAKDISGIKITSMITNEQEVKAGAVPSTDLVNLSAVSGGKLDVAVSGGQYGSGNLPGNVNIQTLGGYENVKLQATGNIIQSGTGTTVQADRIDLVSTNGTVGTALQPIVAHAGQNAVGEDNQSASVNVDARGDIYLNQDSGNMRIGTIVSQSGKVVLQAADGDFIDALPNAGVKTESDIDRLVQYWKDMGLIAGEGLYTKNLAQERLDYKTKATEGLKIYLEQKDYYTAHPEEQETASYIKLKATFGNYTDVDSYLAGDAAYQKLMAEPQYQWTRDMLLYAIKQSVINRSVASTDNEKKAANIAAAGDITLTGKGVGTNDNTEWSILVADMTTEDMKRLANANAADITWGGDGRVLITGKRALGVNAGGKLNLDVTEDAYVAARSLNGDDQGSGPKLTINKINAEGDVRILGKQGVAAGSTDTTTADITANGVYIEGGTAAGSDIGASDRYILLNMTAAAANQGQVSANTAGSIYLRAFGATPSDLYLGSMVAGKDIYVDGADRNLAMTTLGESLGYLNAGGTVNLTTEAANGSIGTAAAPIRLYNGTAAQNIINITNDGDIYLKGMNGADKTGTMSLGSVVSTNGNVGLTSEGELLVGKEDTSAEQQDGFSGRISAGKDATLAAAGNVYLDGPVSAGSTNTITLSSDQGAVAQLDTEAATKALTAQKLVTISAKGQELQNKGNSFSAFSFAGSTAPGKLVDGNINVYDTAAGGLTLDGNDTSVNGEVKIFNAAPGADLTINTGFKTLNGHPLNLTADGQLTNKGTLAASGNLTLQSRTKSIDNQGSISSDQDILLQADRGAISNTKAVQAGGAVTMTAATGITNTSAVTGTGDVTLKTTAANLGAEELAINNTGSITSKAGSVNLDAASGAIKVLDDSGQGTINAAVDANVNTTNGEIAIDGAVAAAHDTTISSDTGSIKIGLSGVLSQDTDVSGGHAVTIKTSNAADKSNIWIYGNVKGQDTVDLSTVKGDIIILGDVSTVTGNVTMNSKSSGNIVNSGSISSTQGDVNIGLRDGNFMNGKDITTTNGGIIVTDANGSIDIGGVVTAGTNVQLEALSGITTNGHVTAGQDIVQTVTGDGTIVNGNGIAAGKSLTEQILGQGDLHINNALTTGQNLNLITNNGSVQLDLPETSLIGGNMYVTAINGSATVNGYMGLGGDSVIRTQNGDVNFNGLLVDPNDASSITLQAENGNVHNNVALITAGSITEKTIGTGSIYNTDALWARGDVTLSADRGEVQMLNDSTIYSDKGTVTLSTKAGDINASDINGENVKILLGRSGDVAVTGVTTVGTKLSYEGDNFLNVLIQQRDGYTNPLHIDAVGAGGNQAMNTFNLLYVDAPNGIIMDRLWSNEALVNAGVPKLDFKALRIEQEGYFFIPSTSATVYGPGGLYDRFDPLQGKAFYAGTASHPWMQLYLKENGSQFSDGVLLLRDDYQRVDNQRYSAVDWSLHLLENELARKMYERYDERTYPGDSYGNYWRYDLVDYRALLQ